MIRYDDIYAGDDHIVELGLYEGNTAVDLTACPQIIAAVKTGTSNYAYFALVQTGNESGYGKLTVKTGLGNEHFVLIQFKKAQTAGMTPGAFDVEVKAKFVDADFADGFRWQTFAFTNIGTVIDRFAKNLPTP